MAGPTIKHDLKETVRDVGALQQNADRFVQFAKSANKELLAQGQQMMQFFQQFNQAVSGMSGGPQGLQTPQGQQFAQTADRNLKVVAQDAVQPVTNTQKIVQNEAARNVIKPVLRSEAAQAQPVGETEEEQFVAPPHPKLKWAQDVVKGEHIRQNDAIRAGLPKPNAPNIQVSDEDIKEARRIVEENEKRKDPPIERIGRAQDAKFIVNKRYSEVPPASPVDKEEPHESKYDLERRASIESLSGKTFQTSTEKRRAEELIATGGPKHLAYDITDINKTQKITEKFGATSQEIEKRASLLKEMKGPNQEIGKEFGVALDKMIQQMKVSNTQYLTAMKEFQQIRANPEIKEDSVEFKTAFEKLQMSMERLVDSNTDLGRINKSAKEFGGGGPPPKTPVQDFFEKARPYAQAAAAVLGTGVAGYAMYQKTALALDEASIGAERRGQEARGSIGSIMMDQAVASADMTSPENLIKYRADMLFGKKYKYIGTEPTRLQDMANTEIQTSLDMSRRQKNLGFVGAAGQIGIGLSTTLGGAALATGGIATGPGVALAGPAGAAMMASGANQIMAGVGAAVDTAAGNRYLMATRQTAENSFIGRYIHGDDRSRDNTRYMGEQVAAEDYKARQEKINSAREAEMREKHSGDLIAFRERERLVETQQQGAVLVGEYAATRQETLEDLFGKAKPARDKLFAIKMESRAVELADPKVPLSDATVKNINDSQKNMHRLKVAKEIVKMTEAGEGLTTEQEKLRQDWLQSGFYNSAKRDSTQASANMLAKRDEARKRFIEATPQLRTAVRVMGEIQESPTAIIPLVYSRAELERRSEGKDIQAEPATRAYDPKTATPTRTSRLQMSPSEFQAHRDMLTNVLGTTGEVGGGIRSTADDTERMVKLGRSGLGSYQALLGNITSINQTQGGQNNIGTLERVLTSAVQAGFDKSRTAQMFVQTTNELSRAVNTANIDVVGRTLGVGAKMFSTTGVADERSMALAAAGTKNFADYSGQTGGLVGALKMQGIFAAGGRIGTGAGLASKVNAISAVGMLAELQDYEKATTPEEKTAAIKSIDLQDMLRAQGGNVAATRKIVSAAGGAGGIIVDAMTKALGGVSVNQKLTEAADLRKRGDDKGADEIIANLRSKVADVGAATEYGAEGGRAWLTLQAVSQGAVTPEVGKELLNRKIDTGVKAFYDPAKAARQKFMDDLLNQSRSQTTGITPTDAAKYNKELGIAVTTSKGEVIDDALLVKAKTDKELNQRINEATKSVDMHELTRAAEIGGARAEGDVQRVMIVNLTDMAQEFLKENLRVISGGKKDLNASTPP